MKSSCLYGILECVTLPDNYIFKQAFDFLMKWEGGYVNDPSDPGGETKYGISKKAYPSLNIKMLSREEAKEIYYRDYWQKCGCDDPNYSAAMSVCIFDTAVNMGVNRALQFARDCSNYKDYIAKRKEYYLYLVGKNKKLSKYLKGWINRITDLRKLCDVLNEEVL